ncbi:MAG TPA: HAMP domain-containing sensor histidine kinase [Vicinamibacterales bacterium]
MRGRFRVPLVVVAVALLGLIVLLATLQYRWLGQISTAERDRMHASLATRTTEFAHEFDGEITRAYLLFQVELPQADQSLAARITARYDRWQSTARFPRMIERIYYAQPSADGSAKLQRYDPTGRFLEPAEWPKALEERGRQLMAPREPAQGGTLIVRAMTPPVWEDVPALVIPAPLLITGQHVAAGDVRFTAPTMAYTVLVLDRGYILSEVLPALAQKHFRGTSDGFDYKLAVVSTKSDGVLYHSADDFSPSRDAKTDATADLLQVRLQDFGSIAAEVRRFASTTFVARADGPEKSGTRITTQQFVNLAPGTARFTITDNAPLSIFVQQQGGADAKAAIASTLGAASARLLTTVAPGWRLLVEHPSGSLEAAVNKARQRNLVISSSILAVLGASVGLLVLSTRRAQKLARQQMEFVAAVSHELRTPLAVIRSAGENLADGVVRNDAQIRKYGELVKSEGRRLTEMVEQILEFAGIQSGQRGFALRPVGVRPLIEDVVSASETLVESAGIDVEWNVPPALPPVLGDEAALRRVFQNLVGNAIKYGASGSWIGISATSTGREIAITIADRGIGIAPADQPHIFEPFYRAPAVVEAQIQGAGLGLSLVKRIVEAHGGRISVESAPGRGSAFTVTLPAATEEPVSRTALADTQSLPAAGSRP